MDPRIRSNLNPPPFEDPAFAPPPRKKAWYRSVEMPFLWLGAGLMFVLVLFLLLFPQKSMGPVFGQGQQMTVDLSGISERLDTLTESVEALRMQRMFAESGEDGLKTQTEVLGALRKINADIAMQMAALSNKIDKIQIPASASKPPAKQVPSAPPAKQATAKPVSKQEPVPAVSPPVTSGSSQTPATKVKTRKSSIPAGTEPLVYGVKSGDTLFSIAKKHGVSVAGIREANKEIPESNDIHPGQKLKIPR